MKIVLASKSPRRKSILADLGLEFSVVTADTDESCEITDPCQLVKELAFRKGEDVAKTLDSKDTLVISADTVVVLDGKILGKPKDKDDAKAMLKALSGRFHKVISGLSLNFGGKVMTECDETTVHFGPMPDSFIEKYAESGDPLDKAGAYAVQGMTSLYIDKIDGCYFNVVGLPVRLLCKSLTALGIDITDISNKL